MTEELFLEKITNILDAEEDITMETQLDDIEEWDSFSVVNYVTMADVDYGVKVNVKDVREAETIQDLYNLLK